MIRARIASVVCLLILVPLLGAAATEAFSEDFSESAEWFSDYWNSRGYIELRQPNEGRVRFACCPETPNHSIYEVDILISRFTDGLAGVLLMSSEPDGWDYGIFFDPDAQYVLYWISPNGDTWNPVRSGAAPGAKKGLNVVNHLRIECTENNTSISFNGNRSFTANATVEVERICLAAGNFEGETVVRFDNLHISSPAGGTMAD